ncbi:mediator complex subunit [Linnemannia gamsii]|uniref:Mediator complex subunit n=1 Tax=Linnemannia gamsii TaxID=64522 RepID=A0ABQ7JID2_9FUNG|nr:mediator complex subunit [Linnemannia gamsii]
MSGGLQTQSVAASNQDPTHITAPQGFAQGALPNPGQPGSTAARMPNTNASRMQAAAAVQSMVERIQTNRGTFDMFLIIRDSKRPVPPNLLGDLSPEQKQSVKEQMNQMMPMFMKLDQLMPFFFALTGNREATARLILMKFMFQDQLDSLKHEQYTITPENLVRLKDRLQHYFMWVKSEMASANQAVPPVQVSGNTTNMTQPSTIGTAPIQSTNAGGQEGMNASVAVADMSGGGGAGTTSTTTYASAPSDQASIPVNHSASTLATTPAVAPSAQGVPGMVVKVGLTPADLKLPPPRKTNNSPPSSSFPGSPRSEAGTPSTPNLGLARPGAGGGNLGTTPKSGKAMLSTPVAPPIEQQHNSNLATQETISPTVSKSTDGSTVPSSQLLLKSRKIQQQQAELQQQQQQVPQILPHQSQQLASQQSAQSGAPQQHSSPLPSSSNSPAKQIGTPLESLSKEELIRQYQVFKGALSGASLPPKQVALVKMQLQRIQGELARPHRQEQTPRLGDGVAPLNGSSVNPAAAVLLTTSSASPADQQFSATQAATTPTAPADLGPQIRELQMQESKVGPSQPMDPLDFLTFSYKSLGRVDETVPLQNGSGDTLTIFRNAFEGFVGKRVGNGPGKDMFDNGPQKRRRLHTTDDALLNAMLLSSDGEPDAFMASYGDWAEQIPAV